MDGKPIVFDQASRNFMKLTASEEGASCPYLYAWDDGQNAWVRHGKMIHEANSKDKEATETITFSASVQNSGSPRRSSRSPTSTT